MREDIHDAAANDVRTINPRISNGIRAMTCILCNYEMLSDGSM